MKNVSFLTTFKLKNKLKLVINKRKKKKKGIFLEFSLIKKARERQKTWVSIKNERNLGSKRVELKLQEIFPPSLVDNVRHGVGSTSTRSYSVSLTRVYGFRDRESQRRRGLTQHRSGNEIYINNGDAHPTSFNFFFVI